jgi:hypothetical protein
MKMVVTVNKHKTTKTVEKTKTTVKPKAKAEVGEVKTPQKMLSAIADEAGALKEKMDLLSAQLKILNNEYLNLTKPVFDYVGEQIEADEMIEGTGKVYICTMGVKGKQTAITNIKRAYNCMKAVGGVALLEETLKFTLTDLKKYLTDSELADILEETQTGPRKITITKK